MLIEVRPLPVFVFPAVPPVALLVRFDVALAVAVEHVATTVTDVHRLDTAWELRAQRLAAAIGEAERILDPQPIEDYAATVPHDFGLAVVARAKARQARQRVTERALAAEDVRRVVDERTDELDEQMAADAEEAIRDNDPLLIRAAEDRMPEWRALAELYRWLGAPSTAYEARNRGRGLRAAQTLQRARLAVLGEPILEPVMGSVEGMLIDGRPTHEPVSDVAKGLAAGRRPRGR